MAENASRLPNFIGVKTGATTVAGVLGGAHCFGKTPRRARRAVERAVHELGVPGGAVLATILTNLVTECSWVAWVTVESRVLDDVRRVASWARRASVGPALGRRGPGRAVIATTLAWQPVESSLTASFAMCSGDRLVSGGAIQTIAGVVFLMGLILAGGTRHALQEIPWRDNASTLARTTRAERIAGAQ